MSGSGGPYPWPPTVIRRKCAIGRSDKSALAVSSVLVMRLKFRPTRAMPSTKFSQSQQNQ